MLKHLFVSLIWASGFAAHAQISEFNICKSESRIFRMEQAVAIAGFYVKVGNDADFITEWDAEIIDQSRTVRSHRGEALLIFQYVFQDSSVAELRYILTDEDAPIDERIIFVEGRYRGALTDSDPVLFEECRLANFAAF